MRRLPHGKRVTTLLDFELVLELREDEPTVLLARRKGPRGFSRWLAVQYLGPFLGDEVAHADRIMEDLSRAQSIAHGSVLRIHEAVPLGPGRVVVTDYQEGATLGELIASGPLSAAIVGRIAGDILAGLAAIHDAEDPRGRPVSLVHGRLEPRCVIVDLEGRTRIGELGLSALPTKYVLSSRESLPFRSAAIIAGEPPSVASDLYAVGAIILASLREPEQRARGRAFDEQKAEESLRNMADRAMRPTREFRSARAFLEELERSAIPASRREAATVLGERVRPIVAEKKSLVAGWVADHEEELGIDGTPGAWERLLVRIGVRNRRRIRAIAWTTGFSVLGALLGLIAWWARFR